MARFKPHYQVTDLEVVYLIQAKEVGRVKIGTTLTDPTKRMKAFQVGSPCELTLVGVLEGGYEREQELHREFASYRLHGEWFDDAVLDEL